MWKLLTLSTLVCVCLTAGYNLREHSENGVTMDTVQQVLDFYDFDFVRGVKIPRDRCPWQPLQACICRDESSYTNGTYKLMVNCTQSGLQNVSSDIPSNTTVLTLDNNNITDITPGVFKNLTILKYLDLSNNRIKQLSDGIFVGLGNLHTLEISGNKIRYENSTIHDGVFKPLTKLARLNLQQNFDGISHREKFPTRALSNLVHLQQLLIDGLDTGDFSYMFSSMTQLTFLQFSSEYGRCNLSRINVDMFKNLSSLANLKLNNCSINHVERGSFSELKSLASLDMSYNEQLHFKSLRNITFGLKNQTMRDLRLVKIHETFGDCTRLNQDDLEYIKDMQINEIYLDTNRLAYLDEEAVDFIPRKIHKLCLTNNMLLAGDYLHKLFDGPVFENLTYLTLAEQNMNYDALKFFSNKTKSMLMATGRGTKYIDHVTEKMVYTSVHENETYVQTMDAVDDIDANRSCNNCHGNGLNYDVILYFPKQLKGLDFSGLRIRNELKNICICQPNDLLRLNLERNIFWNWQGPIAGLENLLNLNLAWNSCDNMSVDVFDHMDSLLELNLTRNFIERFLREDTEGRIFRNLKKLQQLLLGDNKIRSLPKNVFIGLKSLRGLDISNNFLTQFDVKFDLTVPLQVLDLQFNLLGKLGKKIMAKFDDLIHNRHLFSHYYIELLGNKLSCTCKDKDFVKWVSITKVQLIDLKYYKCTYNNGDQKNLIEAEKIYQQLKIDCAQYTVLIISVSLGFVLFLVIIIAGIVYRYRWDLRYFYYSVKLKMKGNALLVNQDIDDTEYTHDAFVSYASENGKFVKEEVVSELEGKRNLRLLVHDRDFRLGEFVSDNIMEAITSSRKTLILMSKHFLKSKWCVFEMHMARMEGIKTGRNVVCLIMLEDVPTAGLPLEIMDIIRQQTYLEMPEEAVHKEFFWDKMRDALAQ